MKNIGIQDACSENWEEMTPTLRGAFCQKCTIDVHDFTGKTSKEIKAILKQSLGERICGRLLPRQEAELNREFEEWSRNVRMDMKRAVLLSFIVVFGLTLFSCSTEKEVQVIENIQRTVQDVQAKITNDSHLNQHFEDVKNVDNVSQVPMSLLSEETGEECELTTEIPFSEYQFNDSDIVEMKMITLGGIGMSSEYADYIIDTEEAHPTIDKEQIEFSSKVYPNPMTEKGTFEFEVAVEGITTIGLYSIQGDHIRNLHEGSIEKGVHSFNLELSNQPAGTYLIIVRSKAYSDTIRFVKY